MADTPATGPVEDRGIPSGPNGFSMDVTFFNDGVHQGSGLGTTDNGPCPTPQVGSAAIYDVSGGQFGTPAIPDTRVDGLADNGLDPNGATSEVGPQGVPGGAPNPASIPQPAPGQTGYNVSGWAAQPSAGQGPAGSNKPGNRSTVDY